MTRLQFFHECRAKWLAWHNAIERELLFLQAEPVYTNDSDALIPDERARAAKLALQTRMNGAASSPELRDPVKFGGDARAAAPDTIESCMEDNCVILSVDTSMQEALQVGLIH